MSVSKVLNQTAIMLLFVNGLAVAQDCGPLRPSQPVNSEMADKTKAKADVLLRSLGSGQIENDYKRIQTDVLNSYPNADRVHMWDSFIYMLCTLLHSSKSLTDAEKLDRYQVLVDKWQPERPVPAATAREERLGTGSMHTEPKGQGSSNNRNSEARTGGNEIGNLRQESHGPLSPPIAGNSGQVTIQGGLPQTQ